MNCKIIVATFGLSVLLCSVSSAGMVTFYADGALVELEASASKGIIEIPLPASLLENSLRIKPLGNAELVQVDIIPAKGEGSKIGKERDTLLEQKNRVQDRLKALETRERIFTAAAKSQSGKAPRKTKANPDPMQSIRQGTDFAIAQLEAVYTARRKAEHELKRLEERIAGSNDNFSNGGSVARVALASQRGAVTVRYVMRGVGWTPRYDLRISNGDATRVDFLAVVPNGFNGYKRYAAPVSYADAGSSFPVAAGSSLALMARYNLPVSEQDFGSGGQTRFSFVLKNSEKLHLPAGDATVYRKGEYVGKIRFEGISSGRSRMVVGGK